MAKVHWCSGIWQWWDHILNNSSVGNLLRTKKLKWLRMWRSLPWAIARVTTKMWYTSYHDLLNVVNIQFLEMHSSLCTQYQIVHGVFLSSRHCFTETKCQRTNRELQPFAHTNAIHNSFAPLATNIWNFHFSCLNTSMMLLKLYSLWNTRMQYLIPYTEQVVFKFLNPLINKILIL